MKLNHSHFNISTKSNNHTSYQQWHEYKLNNAPNYLEDDLNCLFVEIDYAQSPSSKQCESILEACQKHSFGLYRINNLSPDDKQHIHSFASTLGLTTLDSNICADTDSLTSITRTKHKGQHEYIPYSDRRLSWHTDGYYNTPENTINSMLLHCAQPAKEGGESLLMDHEIAYLLLRDENPAYIQALMQDDAMTIPVNILDGGISRSIRSPLSVESIASFTEKKQPRSTARRTSLFVPVNQCKTARPRSGGRCSSSMSKTGFVALTLCKLRILSPSSAQARSILPKTDCCSSKER